MLRVRQHHRLTDGDLAAILCEQSLSYAKEPSQSNCGAGLRQKCWFWGRRRPRGVGGLCAAGRRSRSVRRLVTNPICGSIYRSRSTRSSRRLERSSELVALIRSRAISAHETSTCEIARDQVGSSISSQGHIRANNRVECAPEISRTPGIVTNRRNHQERDACEKLL